MRRILTVDDNATIRAIVTRLVRGMGLEVDEAVDGIEGLQKLREARYDVVILDIAMPRLSGPDMLAKMRDMGIRTPVIVLSTESKTSILTELVKVGIADFILMPFKLEVLRDKILKALPASDEEQLSFEDWVRIQTHLAAAKDMDRDALLAEYNVDPEMWGVTDGHWSKLLDSDPGTYMERYQTLSEQYTKELAKEVED